MEFVSGYFTVERNILNSTLPELETKLGLRHGRLANGARVVALIQQPAVGQFVFAGSTRYPDAKGLIDRRGRQNFPVPHAWYGQRLVKVIPNTPHTADEQYPSGTVPVEQWQLIVPVPAVELCRLSSGETYWPPRP